MAVEAIKGIEKKLKLVEKRLKSLEEFQFDITNRAFESSISTKVLELMLSTSISYIAMTRESKDIFRHLRLEVENNLRTNFVGEYDDQGLKNAVEAVFERIIEPARGRVESILTNKT